MSAPTTTTPRGSVSVIELEIAAESGPGWLGSGAEPVTVSLTAEKVRFDGTQLHFVTGNTVVRSVPQSEVTALTWRGSPPRGRAPGPHRNAGVMWTEEERARLTAEVLGDLSWIEISHRHERTVSAVRREAVRMRLVDELGRRLDAPTPTRTPADAPATNTPAHSPTPMGTPANTALTTTSQPTAATISASTRSTSARPAPALAPSMHPTPPTHPTPATPSHPMPAAALTPATRTSPISRVPSPPVPSPSPPLSPAASPPASPSLSPSHPSSRHTTR